MSRFIIERYIYDALNARADLGSAEAETRRELAQGILRDIDLYFADHMDDVLDARERLSRRDDEDARAMLAYLDERLASHEDAERVALAAIAKASRG